MALSSKNLDKYEYLTGKGEDLGLKPSTIEQAKFEYSLLGKSFNKVLDKDDKEEGLFTRLRNIESKNEDQGKKQLEAIKNNNMGSKPLKTISFFGTISEEAKKLMVNIKKKIDDWLGTAQHICTKEKQNMTLTILRFPHYLL